MSRAGGEPRPVVDRRAGVLSGPSPRLTGPLVAVVVTLLAACSGQDAPPAAGPEGSPTAPAVSTPPGEPSPSAATSSPAPPTTARPGPSVVPRSLRIAGTIASNLDAPWGLAFLPGGSALVAERDRGRIVEVRAGGRVRVAGEVPGVRPGGEGGLLGLAVSPTFDADRFVYAYFTGREDNRIVRMRFTPGGPLGPPQPVLTGIPSAGFHNGGRLLFGPDGMLYAGTGDAGDRGLSQDRDSLGGKILRLAPDGSVPPGNPFPRSLVWSYGHRNVQGLAFDPSGRLWASEFGQNAFDELNLIEPGRNYGWPRVEGRGGAPDYVEPRAVWDTDEASPSGVAVWGDAVYLAALRGARLWQVPLPGAASGGGEPRAYFSGRLGRLRTVAVAPDGSLWVVTSNTDGRGDPREDDDKILRVVPG